MHGARAFAVGFVATVCLVAASSAAGYHTLTLFGLHASLDKD